MCTDCNIGFRKHGILAKHLRSKTHVMKLESLRIIPEDSLSLITRKEGGVYLNEIDTTDCEHARQSILGQLFWFCSFIIEKHINLECSTLVF